MRRPATPSPRFTPANPAEWRAWLAEHHAEDGPVWLVLFKRGGPPRAPTMADAVEQALCFGWIDGGIRRLDEARYLLRFTPRRADSVWSETNLRRVAKLQRAGLMAEPGLAVVRAAKRRGAWRRTAGTPRQEEPPADLAEALAADAAARANYERFAPGYRRLYIAWILAAKRPETRRKRVETTVARCRAGLRPGIDL
jgi:uncharacterized protein YdeI (YjbR/CyaY-like superfamily)